MGPSEPSGLMLQPLGSSNVGACSAVGVAGACSAVGSPWLAQPSERERDPGACSAVGEREREEKERNKGEIVIGFMGGRPTRERRADGRGADGRERETGGVSVDLQWWFSSNNGGRRGERERKRSREGRGRRRWGERESGERERNRRVGFFNFKIIIF